MNFISIGAFLSAFSVILGAFGAHGIKNTIDPALFETYQTASHYLFLHSMALLFYGLFCRLIGKTNGQWPGKLFLLGMLLFSGSLYLIVFTGIKAFGMITPLGGLSFIIAWIGFGLHAKRV
jgi:uncharacterized membrane protein YgdD (TMEM256/DUF423 family)